MTKEEIALFERSEITRLFNEIRPANPKHLYNYAEFLKTGWVPLHRDIDYKRLNASAGS